MVKEVRDAVGKVVYTGPSEGKQTLGVAWWLSLFPGLAILLTVLGYNLLGEGLRDLLDPRLAR